MKHTIITLIIMGTFCVSFASTQAQTTANDALIQKLLAQLAVLQAELNKLRGSTNEVCTFTRPLYFGIQGTDVSCLQRGLKVQGFFFDTPTGLYGPKTQDAVIRWQQHAGIIPEPKAIGMFGPRSQTRFLELSRVAVVEIPRPQTDIKPVKDTSFDVDIIAPTAPGTPIVMSVSETRVQLSWDKATDKNGIDRYTIYRDGVEIGQSQKNSYSVKNLVPDTSYTFTVTAFDDAGNTSMTSGVLQVTTQASVVAPALVIPKSYTDVTASLSGNEGSCSATGWKKITTKIGGQERELLWKGPSDAWKGSIIVMHGGGGDYTQWCYNSAPAIKPQVDFSDLAVSRGFGVFLLESTNDVVTDANGRVCGKRFDATVVDGRSTNVDLPFIERVITDIIPPKRVSGSSPSIFITGESTGGYMTTRAATHFDNLVTAFAPAASGDPYGTYFDCNPDLSPRDSAKGAGFDRETNIQIIMPNSCVSPSYPNEKPWETMSPGTKPAFKTFHHADDGVADLSCREKVATQLRANGYPDDGAYVIPSSGTRSVWAHFWQSAYNRPVLDFFEKYSR